ncbi:MAG: ABC transporter ATP-binding protein, partial [Clostridia bacterium]|nr:ABC transporter ATP-binding protein [Clostridia bacterium]
MNSNKKMPPMQGGKRKIDKGTLGRVVKLLFKSYPVLIPITIFCIVFSAMVSSIPSLFIKNVLEVVDKYTESGNFNWSEASKEIIPIVAILAGLYVLSLIFITTYTQLMAYITQGFLSKMRCKMFDGMQNLPIKYFDTNKHGDIMSYYTNDIDTLRQLISQSLPQLLQSSIIVCTVLFLMLWYSVWMTLVVLTGVVAMLFVSKKVGGGSAKYFIRQQKSIGKA